MARFTGGSARYMRRVNTGNYEHKEFEAVIAWSSDEGDGSAETGDMIARASDEAVAVVHQRLGLVAPGPTTSIEEFKATRTYLAPTTETVVAPEPEPEPVRRPGRPKKNPDAVAPPPLTVVSDPLLSPAVVAELSQPPEISDRDLLDHATKWVHAHGGQEAVLPLRNLIRSFDAPQLAMVPQERRAEFLAKLAELSL